MTDYYHFQIGPDSNNLFACYTLIRHKSSNRSEQDEINDLINDRAIGWADWTMPNVPAGPNKLDLAFDSLGKKILFFQIFEPNASHHHTQFSTVDPISTLRAVGFESASVIIRSQSFNDLNSEPTWALAEVDFTTTRSEVRASHNNYDRDGKELVKLPFMFNFVDHRTDVSPTTKSLTSDGGGQHGALFGDGRIHPDVFSNIISIPG